jgi:hypothetical protein
MTSLKKRTIGDDFLRADRDRTTLNGLAGNDTLRGASRQANVRLVLG